MKHRWTTWGVIEEATKKILDYHPTRQEALNGRDLVCPVCGWKPQELRIVKLTLEGEW